MDSADKSKFSSSRAELTTLIEKPVLCNIPLLVLANKNDLSDAATAEEVIEIFGLRDISDREVACYSISAKNSNNLDTVLNWLMKHATSK